MLILLFHARTSCKPFCVKRARSQWLPSQAAPITEPLPSLLAPTMATIRDEPSRLFTRTISQPGPIARANNAASKNPPYSPSCPCCETYASTVSPVTLCTHSATVWPSTHCSCCCCCTLSQRTARQNMPGFSSDLGGSSRPKIVKPAGFLDANSLPNAWYRQLPSLATSDTRTPATTPASNCQPKARHCCWHVRLALTAKRTNGQSLSSCSSPQHQHIGGDPARDPGGLDEVEVEEDDADEDSEEARGEIFAATGEATRL